VVRRSIVCIVFVLWMLAAPTAAQGASAAMKTAVVSEAGIRLSYPAGWVNVAYDASDFKTLLEVARSQDSHVTRRQVRDWVDAAKSVDASFFAMERRSGDNVLVNVRDDDFDAAFDASTSVDQLEDELRAELKQKGLRLVGHVEQTSVGSQRAYRWSTVFGGARTADLYFAQPDSNATVAIAVTTDNDAKGRRVADSILDSAKLAD
jgi:hypothetical protein